MSRLSLFAFLVVSVLVASTQAFCPPSKSLSSVRAATSPPLSSTQLAERQWNFNEGRSPWGLKKNAEIWNGRLAQVR